jgi:hypothetical protein
MKNGRINERNIGSWTHGGEPKHQSKPKALPELSPEKENALDAVRMIDNLLKSHKGGYYSYVRYDLSNTLITHWVQNGIVTKGVKESQYAGFEPKEICHLNESRIDDLKMVRGFLVSLHKLELYV